MIAPESQPRRKLTIRGAALLAVAFIAGAVVMTGIGILLTNIQSHKDEANEYPLKMVEIGPNEIDPAVWGKNFPREYDAFMKTQDSTISTPFGGSVPYSKLERVPAMVRIWAGYAFSIDYNAARGHYYALIDQKNTKRQGYVKQPGACANCHAAEAPQLIAQMGWENFNHTPYATLSETLHTGSSCADCHDPKTMELRITRPAFVNAMNERGIDVSTATRQEMRTYVCAQCHVEYYFKGDNKVLTFPWDNGLNIDEIEAYYDEIGFKDWTHKETNAPMLKMQHPEFEMWSSGLHAKSGVTCADCHMPYVREGVVKISDHWLRSPLTNLNNACQTCHKQDEQALKERVLTIQERTATLLRRTETALINAIDAISAAQAAGASDSDLEQARTLHRRASMRWDFVSSENSTGFHSPQEAARILADAIDYARQAQVEAINATPK
ncbi:MAG: ammonia-forming cytochrome c nitrite reductase subunit c552 [Chloroflexi bacterium]|nr:ammonia-forming cytochrome c nitrite reductase subunit c552 [Chloroflexota bacterium]